MTGLQNIPVTSATSRHTQLLGGLAQVKRTNSMPSVSTTMFSP